MDKAIEGPNLDRSQPGWSVKQLEMGKAARLKNDAAPLTGSLRRVNFKSYLIDHIQALQDSMRMRRFKTWMVRNGDLIPQT
jgi:hypothetical protein